MYIIYRNIHTRNVIHDIGRLLHQIIYEAMVPSLGKLQLITNGVMRLLVAHIRSVNNNGSKIIGDFDGFTEEEINTWISRS